jgi:adenylate cyclase
VTTRRLVAILAADVVGYSRMVAADEAGTLARLRAARRDVVDPLMVEFKGRVFKVMGDGLLAEFPSAVQALRCAIAIQQRLREGDGLQVRIGLHQGDVVAEGGDLLGDGVNVAARLEALAEAGGICISARVREDAAGKMSLDVEDVGTPQLKNIAQPVHVFRVRLDAERPALALPDKPSIAVLAFQNMSGDPEQEYFADGMVEDITTALSRIAGLFVIARNSSFAYKGKSTDVRQVARELGVRYVLEGSVRKAGGRVRITCQLVEAASGNHIWADRYDGTLDNLFDLQDQITEAVAGIMEPTIARAEIERVRRKPPNNMDAYDQYLRGLANADTFTRRSIQTTLDHCLRAIELDSSFAPAFALAANAYLQRKVQGWVENPADDAAQALDIVERGLFADRLDPMMLVTAGHCFAYFANNLATGIAYIDEAIALNPNLASAYIRSAIVRNHAGQIDLGIEHVHRALRLSPRDSSRYFAYSTLSMMHMIKRDFEAGYDWALRATRANPNYASAWRNVAAAAALLGRRTEARHATERLLAISPRFSINAYRSNYPGFSAPIFDHYFEALCQAGLPE